MTHPAAVRPRAATTPLVCALVGALALVISLVVALTADDSGSAGGPVGAGGPGGPAGGAPGVQGVPGAAGAGTAVTSRPPASDVVATRRYIGQHLPVPPGARRVVVPANAPGFSTGNVYYRSTQSLGSVRAYLISAVARLGYTWPATVGGSTNGRVNAYSGYLVPREGGQTTVLLRISEASSTDAPYIPRGSIRIEWFV
ncbi:hypothetical protein [Jatrophihabitans fulvus]